MASLFRRVCGNRARHRGGGDKEGRSGEGLVPGGKRTGRTGGTGLGARLGCGSKLATDLKNQANTMQTPTIIN